MTSYNYVDADTTIIRRKLQRFLDNHFNHLLRNVHDIEFLFSIDRIFISYNDVGKVERKHFSRFDFHIT